MTIRVDVNITKRDKKKKITPEEKNRPPYFSVILCTYNRRSSVLATLACLREQTLAYHDFEVIVVDNGSQDGTLHAINAYIKAKGQKQRALEGLWRIQCLSETKNGLAYARNAGLRVATGDIVVFVDDDTLLDPHMLENLWLAYEETRADAIGMRVMVHWDIACPHWMIEELLPTLGHFSPSSRRLQLTSGGSFANCGFSVKRNVLHALKYYPPFLSRRINLPASMEVADLCQRLRQAGYTLWYEPEALVLHRVTSARLHQAFFVGRAYWQGRSEVMLNYLHTRHERALDVWREILSELGNVARCLFVQTPLIHLAGRPTTERLLAAMEQAHFWGRLVQRLRYLEHIPPELEIPAVLLVHSAAPDDSLNFLISALDKREVDYLTGQPEIPLGWLWRHRSYHDQPVGILHFYQPGALELTNRQSQYLRFRLWLARYWGLRIVVTDNGGWWQSAHGPHCRRRRAIERKTLCASHMIIAATHQPNQLYRDRRWRKRARHISQPGFRGCYPPALPREEAYQSLGIVPTTTFVYLCFAHLHVERELLFLLEAFHALTQGNRRDESLPDIQLLLVGHPADGEPSPRLQELIERDSAVHVHASAYQSNDLPQYMGACDTLVLPHLAVRTSGCLEIANIALSYERLVIAPDLPRFSGMLPQHASVPYVPASRESLAEALVKAQQIDFTLQPAEDAALDFQQSWADYTRNLLKIYRELLGQTSS
jgi:glycosyltransferase involved in cell wall biosynthesis